MSVLQPYIDSKKLVVQSGQTGMKKVGTLRWDGAVAQARMDNLLSAHYTDKRVDAVLSPYDGSAIASGDRPGCGDPFHEVDHSRRAALNDIQRYS